MDQVFFSVKRAFHATLRWGRPVLREVGLTPARFDVLYVLGEPAYDSHGPIRKTQVWLRKALGVARATMCEMLGELERLGWIVRSRDARDKRTLRVELTSEGRELLERAYELAVGSGRVPLTVDYAMADGSFDDSDMLHARDWLDAISNRIRKYFGDTAKSTLYTWHPEDIGGLVQECWPDSSELLSCEAPHQPLSELEVDALAKQR